MKMRGSLVYWKFSSFSTNREVLEKKLQKLGDLPSVKTSIKKYKGKSSQTYVDLLPRNDYKAAMIRALRKILKADESSRFYKRLKDQAEAVNFTVIMPIEILEGKAPHYEFKNEVSLELNKATGEVKFSEVNPFEDIILSEFKEMQKLVDSEQVSKLFARIMVEEIHGVSLKLGVYYVGEDQMDKVQALQEIVTMIDSPNLELFKIPVYNDESTLKAVEAAVNDDMLDKLETLKEEICQKWKDDSLSPKVLENRQVAVQELFGKLKIHKEDLRSKASIIENRLVVLEKSLSKIMDISDKSKVKNDIWEVLMAI